MTIFETINSTKTLPLAMGVINELNQIAEGGNSFVYEGKINDKVVALKVLKKVDEGKRRRFVNEYFTMNALPANNLILRPYNFEKIVLGSDEYFAILMPLCNSRLVRAKAISPDDIFRLYDFLKKTLRFIHSHNVIHRDIKPENILVQHGSLFLSDFGIAHLIDYNIADHNTKPGERLANFSFSAPELYDNKLPNAVAPTMDIYSMGQILQWYVTGNIHKGTNRQRLRDIDSRLANLDFIVEKCLSNHPKDRFQNIQELLTYEQQLSDERDIVRKADKAWEDIRAFKDLLDSIAPEKREQVFCVTNYAEIQRLLEKLGKLKFHNHLWWTRGRSDAYIQRIDTTKNPFLIESRECNIKQIWINRDDPQEYLSFMYVICNPLKFQIEKEGTREEVALVDGAHYISRQEFDRGYATINGEVVKLSEHSVDLRIRFSNFHNFFICPSFATLKSRENDQLLDEFCHRVDLRGSVESKDIETLIETLDQYPNEVLQTTM